MSRILITFIIPAYNAAPYLQACVDSVYSLDLGGHDREVIVVDDGSIDDTEEVMEHCKMLHPDLRTVTTDNHGPGAARNVAMDMASGEYVCFVDADDELDYECDIRPLLSLLEKGETDVIGIDCEQVDMDGLRAPYRRYTPIYNKVYAPGKEFMRGRNLFPCVWSYLYRRQFLETARLRFMPGVYHEDDEFVVRTFAQAETFVALDLPLYIRVLRSESITTTTDPEKQQKKLRDILKVLKALDDFAGKDEELRRCMSCKMDYIVVDMLLTMMHQKHPKAFKKEIINALRAMKRFPMRWRWEWKYMVFNVYTRIRVARR